MSTVWPRRRTVIDHTGGTTGTALEFAKSKEAVAWHWATAWRHRGRFGLRHTDPYVVFAGRSVVPLGSMEPPIWRRNLPMHQTYVSVHHMTRRNMLPLVQYLKQRCFAYYLGYPSALYLLARYLLDEGVRLPTPPRMVVTASETVLPHQRRAIEEAFNSELTDHYSSSESCGGISECERHAYHPDMEFGILEFLSMEGMRSKSRKIICTSLHNKAMPFIRYDVGDVATLSDDMCPCGRQTLTIERIDGRIEGIIVTPDGRQLGRLDFLFKSTDQVKEAQLVQDALDHLRVNVVRRDGYRDEDERDLLKSLRAYLGDAIRIDLEYLPEIPREPNGKFRQIISVVSPSGP